ncbi:hypothetical protein RF11_00933 [Thelohanellus kitauei]|uniref:PDZ domain-containing protein n=1 Tax=Thelohanellus kitauei TaxID=669202 RepID=A0A0C2IZ14_THEKT|nr:hypothetical protein RF11_00933 [Thelohanellus kitauei]
MGEKHQHCSRMVVCTRKLTMFWKIRSFIIRPIREISNLQFANTLQESVSEHLISRYPPSPSRLSFVYDVSASLSYLVHKFMIQPDKLSPLKLDDLVDLKVAIDNRRNLEEHSSILLDHFAQRPTEFYNQLYWAHNPDFFFERYTVGQVQTTSFRLPNNKLSCGAYLSNFRYERVKAGSVRDGLIKLMFRCPIWKTLVDEDWFKLNGDDVMLVHQRKCVGDVPSFGNPSEKLRLVAITNKMGALGFGITGGQLICTSDNTYYQKYEYSPIFVDEVVDGSPAFTAGLRQHDKILGINLSNIQGMDLEVIKHLIKNSFDNGSVTRLSVLYSPDEYGMYENLIKFYTKSKEEFDPEPKSDHPCDIARANKRPLWRMGLQKKIRTL